MRLVQVAKALGMTGQQLRHELSDVNFGIKPTDREIPDNLAQGVIRYVASKHGIDVDMAALGFSEDDEAPAVAEAETEKQEEEAEEKSEHSESLHVLRKLSLEDVSSEAIKREEKKLDSEKPERPKKRVAGSAAPALKPAPRKKASESNQEQIKKKEGTVTLPAQVSVKEFAEKTGVQVPKVVGILMKNGIMATINQEIDYDTAAIVATELGVTVAKEVEAASAEDILTRNLEELLKDEPENLTARAPVVVIMGHVDHGKTSILDAIRETDVVSGESGGITQHIGAYQVEHDGYPITYLDTPGHEAFTAMRARGAQITDLAVIVVAADEGIKPTTVEAINHAKDAGVPIIVAINKMDKESADPERVKGELAGYELQAEDWGGKIPMIPMSAKTKMGLNDLLDSIVLVSQMEELKANKNRDAVATVIESHLDTSLGSLATVVVNTGTLKQGDSFVCGNTLGRVRTMMDAHGDRLEEAGPSFPVQISGYSELPQVGDILQVVPSEAQARSLLEGIKEEGDKRKKRSFVDLVSRLSEGKLKQLKVVLKADAQGSLEAIQEALHKLSFDDVAVKIIHAAIGTVTETDVMMAAASDGVVIGFHVQVPTNVQTTAEREGVEVRQYEVVYALLDDVDGLIKGLVEPEEEEQIFGHIELKGIFMTKKTQQVVGGKVTDGVIKRLPFRVQRGGEEVGTGRITSLKHVDKDIKEAKEGSECGMRTESNISLEEGDVLEVYLKELKKKT